MSHRRQRFTYTYRAYDMPWKRKSFIMFVRLVDNGTSWFIVTWEKHEGTKARRLEGSFKQARYFCHKVINKHHSVIAIVQSWLIHRSRRPAFAFKIEMPFEKYQGRKLDVMRRDITGAIRTYSHTHLNHDFVRVFGIERRPIPSTFLAFRIDVRSKLDYSNHKGTIEIYWLFGFLILYSRNRNSTYTGCVHIHSL